MIDRWKLRRWGRGMLLLAAVCYTLAELLDRANQLAVRRAESAIDWHEHNQHNADE